jgi:NAD(P)-dependent dehydrogenase (short-subunit alcohol dehydrogenase family)
MELNLSDLESVENFTKIFKKEFNKLDILVNNAGINVGRKLYDGIEELFVTNYLGHYLLFRKLSPLLTSKSNSSIFSSESRVINLSSVMHHTGSPDYTSSAFGKGSTSVYDDTKLYMNLLTIEINKRYQEKNCPNEKSSADISQTSCASSRSIRAISANPGAVKSDIWRNVPKEIMWIYQIFMNIFYLTPEQGSETSVYAALCKFDDLNFPSSNNYSNKWCSNIYLPYLIPY